MSEEQERITINNARGVSEQLEKQIEDMFTYQPWTPDFVEKGNQVRTALAGAVKVIINNVPPGPDRTVAIRKIREARMDCNSAITHSGKY